MGFFFSSIKNCIVLLCVVEFYVYAFLIFGLSHLTSLIFYVPVQKQQSKEINVMKDEISKLRMTNLYVF